MLRRSVSARLRLPTQVLGLRFIAAMLLGLIVLLVPVQSAVAQAVYEEGTFDLDHWTWFGPFATPEDDTYDGTPAVRAEARTSGGNPGGYLRFGATGVAVPLGSSTVTWAMLINDQAVYDPQALGAIERVDFDIDARVPPEGRLQRVVTIAVEQNGFVWAAIVPRLFIQDKSWLPRWMSGLQAEDFITVNWAEEGQEVNPDFSEEADPIKFGLALGTSCPTTSDCSGQPVPSEADIDNWRVAVNENDFTLRLSVGQVDGPGTLSELPLEFEFLVTAQVRNTTSPDLGNITVRFLLPKMALAGFTIPEDECVPDSASRNDFVIADCTVPGPIGPGSTDTVQVPTEGISVGYANVVPDRTVFPYKAGVLPLTGTDPDPDNDVADLVDLAVCNPSGMGPVRVDDVSDCDDLMTGGTSGAGGTGGTAGSSSGGGGGCSVDVVTSNASEAWFMTFFLAGVALWLRRRRR